MGRPVDFYVCDLYLELDVISLNSLDGELHLARADAHPIQIKLDLTWNWMLSA